MKFPKIWLGALLGIICIGCGDKPFAEYNPPGGKFKIQFPGTPKVSTIPAQNNTQVTMHGVEGFSGGYMVNHYDAPGPVPQDADFAQKALSEDIKGMFSAKAKGTVQSQKNIKLQGQYHGIEYVGTITSPRTMDIRGRIYLVGSRVYNTTVMGSTEKVNSENANKFLDSFQATP